MKRTTLALLAVLFTLALILFGCKKQETYNNATDTATTGTSATDTSGTTTTTDTSGTSGTTGSAVPLSNDDKEFVTKAAEGGMAEVTLGQMAAQNATSPDVKNFGNRMVTDHGKANDELKALATNKGLTLPTETDKEHKNVADKLSKEKGTAFDKAYMDDMVKDHEKDVKEFEKASKDAKDPDLKNWAAKTLPTLQDHLKMAKEVQSKVRATKG